MRSNTVTTSLFMLKVNKMRNIKGQVGPGAIVPFIMVLVVAIVLLTVGSYITYSVGNTMPAGSTPIMRTDLSL